MKKSNSTETSKLDRKTIERNRRIHMKALCFKLASLIPPHHLDSINKDMMSQIDQLQHATSYIEKLRARIEELKERKEKATNKSTRNVTENVRLHNDDSTNYMCNDINEQTRIPTFELRELDSSIELIIISGLKKNFWLYEVISILEEEGAEVTSASFSTIEDKVYHTIHAQVKYSRVGVETSRVCQRLQELMLS